jgi:hypothetical protein
LYSYGETAVKNIKTKRATPKSGPKGQLHAIPRLLSSSLAGKELSVTSEVEGDMKKPELLQALQT